VKFSMLWTSSCGSYDAAGARRVAESGAVLDAARGALAGQAAAAGWDRRLLVVVNIGPARHGQYPLQTVASMLQHLSPSMQASVRIELAADDWGAMSEAATARLTGVSPDTLRGLWPVVQAVTLAANGTSGGEKPAAGHGRADVHEAARWRQASVEHYARALDRCVAVAAEYCLVLDDDVAASGSWAHDVDRIVQELDGRDPHWTMVKLFQPVWGNSQAGWHPRAAAEMVLLSFALGALPWLLWRAAVPADTACGRDAVGAAAPFPPRERRAFAAVMAVICWWALVFVFLSVQKPNLEMLFGDGHVHPHGACPFAQANLFHRARVEAAGLQAELRRSREHIDISICHFFQERLDSLGPMWAVTPSVFQHVGFRTSHPTKGYACPVGKFHEGVWEGHA